MSFLAGGGAVKVAHGSGMSDTAVPGGAAPVTGDVKTGTPGVEGAAASKIGGAMPELGKAEIPGVPAKTDVPEWKGAFDGYQKDFGDFRKGYESFQGEITQAMNSIIDYLQGMQGAGDQRNAPQGANEIDPVKYLESVAQERVNQEMTNRDLGRNMEEIQKFVESEKGFEEYQSGVVENLTAWGYTGDAFAYANPRVMKDALDLARFRAMEKAGAPEMRTPGGLRPGAPPAMEDMSGLSPVERQGYLHSKQMRPDLTVEQWKNM